MTGDLWGGEFFAEWTGPRGGGIGLFCPARSFGVLPECSWECTMVNR